MEKVFPIAQRLLTVYDEMQRGERRLADLLLEDVGVLGYLTVSDLADQAGISKATADFFSSLVTVTTGTPSGRYVRTNQRELQGPTCPRFPAVLCLRANTLMRK